MNIQPRYAEVFLVVAVPLSDVLPAIVNVQARR